MTDDDMQDEVVDGELEEDEEDAGILPEDIPEIPDEEEEAL